MTINKADFRFYFAVFVVLVSIRLWSFQVIPDGFYDFLELVLVATLTVITITNWKVLKKKTLIFKGNVLTFVLLTPLISTVAAYVFHQQTFLHSALILRTFLFWQFYFVLHIYNVPEERIIKMIIFVGSVWAALTIIQQFTYPTYYFYTRTDTGDNARKILRAGVYRFMLFRHHYGMFAVLLFFYRYFTTNKLNNLVYALLILIGFYYFGTRQFAVALIGCVVIMALLIRGARKIFPILFIIFSIIAIYIGKDALFGQYIQMTSDQVSNDDDIRLLAANFYWNEYWPNNFFARITGNGLPHSYSTYGKEIETIHETFRFHQVDIGIIGAYSIYGLVYIINILSLNIKGLNSKFYTYGSLWMRLIFFNSLILMFISEYYWNKSTIPFYCLVLYLVDLSYARKLNLKRLRALQRQEAIETQI